MVKVIADSCASIPDRLIKQLDIEIPHLPASVLDGMPKVVRDHIVALEGIIETLLGHVKELSLKVEEAGREGKRQATPFRTDKKRRRKKRKKPGRKGGHQQERRSEPDHVDETDEARHAERCSCGGCVKTVEVYEQTQDDVEPRKVVRRIRIYVGECEQCGKKVEGRSPFQASTARGNADHQIGPTALALAADLHFGQGVPYDKVREHLQHLGIEVATSTLVRAMERIAARNGVAGPSAGARGDPHRRDVMVRRRRAVLAVGGDRQGSDGLLRSADEEQRRGRGLSEGLHRSIRQRRRET